MRAALAAGGFDLTGTLPLERYDRIVPDPWKIGSVCPEALGVLVVGNAGTGLWPRFLASPESRLRRDPLDRYTARVFTEAVTPAKFALYHEKREGGYLPLVALARAAGFGAPGRVGVLLHPVYGPWISIRGVVFLTSSVGESVADRQGDLCSGCPAPCETACHGEAVGPEGVDVETCFRTKILKRPCRKACDARSACVIGREHAFPPDQIAHHSRIRWRPATARRAVRTLLRNN